MTVIWQVFAFAGLLLCASPAQALYLYTDGVEVMVTAGEMNAALARENGWRLVGSGDKVRVSLEDVASTVDWVAAVRTIDGILADSAKLSDAEVVAGENLVNLLQSEATNTTPVPLERVKLAREALQAARERRGKDFGAPVVPIGDSGFYLSITRYQDNFVPPGNPDGRELDARDERRLCLYLVIEDRSSNDGMQGAGDSLQVRDSHGRMFDGGKLRDSLSPQPRLVGGTLLPGARIEGWVCRAVPKKLDLGDLAFRWRNGPYETPWVNLGR